MPEFHEESMTLLYEIGDNDDVIVIPAVFIVCSTCRGRGSHSRAVDGHGITSSERNNEWSSEEQEMYLRGDYDQQCEECRGRRVAPAPDWSRLEASTRKLLREWYEDEEQYARMCESERRFGA